MVAQDSFASPEDVRAAFVILVEGRRLAGSQRHLDEPVGVAVADDRRPDDGRTGSDDDRERFDLTTR